MSAPKSTVGPRAAAVQNFRKCCIDKGYKAVRVRSMDKPPIAKQWQYGESEDQLMAVEAGALNTGIVAAGLRCIDVDVDDPQTAAVIKKKVLPQFPDAIIRVRANSSRFAIVIRATQGEPGKRAIVGPRGKVEILGAGQQFVADGLHPSGDAYEWENGRGPDTVPVDQLPAATEAQISEIVNECAPLLGSNSSATGSAMLSNIFEQPVPPLSIVTNNTAPVENTLGAGVESVKWFDGLNAEEKSALVGACLNAIDNRAVDPREQWLRVLFAVADAGTRGCPDAEQLAREWSRYGRGWTGDADFDTAWRSWKPGPIGIGTLIATAKRSGLDLSPWRDVALVRLQMPSPPGAPVGDPPITLVQRHQRASFMFTYAIATLDLDRAQAEELADTAISSGDLFEDQ